MKKQKEPFWLTLVISILVGIILPFDLGVKDPFYIVIFFSLMWFIYAIILLITTFLLKPGLRMKASRKNGVTIVRYEVQNPGEKK
jgi:hypothetical protein